MRTWFRLQRPGIRIEERVCLVAASATAGERSTAAPAAHLNASTLGDREVLRRIRETHRVKIRRFVHEQRLTIGAEGDRRHAAVRLEELLRVRRAERR